MVKSLFQDWIKVIIKTLKKIKGLPLLNIYLVRTTIQNMYPNVQAALFTAAKIQVSIDRRMDKENIIQP